MRRQELVYLELLSMACDGNRRTTQAGLAASLAISLSTVHHALGPLRRMGAVEVKRRSLTVLEPRKLLYHWASVRTLGRDIVYATRVEASVMEIEKEMPPGTMYTAYSGYRLRFGDAPADYSEVYAYARPEECRKRFPPRPGQPNLFILGTDKALERHGSLAPLPLLFVDLWNIDTWYAKDFLRALEERLHGILE